MDENQQKIAHALGIPPWILEGGWPLRRRIVWSIKHPRRRWRVWNENRKRRQ